MTDLQTEVAVTADRLGAHATAPTLLLQIQAALGSLAANANAATEAGRRPFRVPASWPEQLGELAHGIYLLADQTGVNLDDEVRRASAQLGSSAY